MGTSKFVAWPVEVAALLADDAGWYATGRIDRFAAAPVVAGWSAMLAVPFVVVSSWCAIFVVLEEKECSSKD